MLNIDETFLRDSTRQAIQAAREALASDPANLLTQQVSAAISGKASSLALNLVLDGAPAPETGTISEPPKPEPEPEPSTLTAADVRARAEEVGYDLNGRSLRSQADKEQAMAEIETWKAEAEAERLRDIEEAKDDDYVDADAPMTTEADPAEPPDDLLPDDDDAENISEEVDLDDLMGDIE